MSKPNKFLFHNKGNEMRTYHLTPAQKNFLSTVNGNINFRGDDNDFSCYLSQLSLQLFIDGKTGQAWTAYQHDPMACFGVTFAAWESGMKTQVIRHLENQAAMESHSESMSNAG